MFSPQSAAVLLTFLLAAKPGLAMLDCKNIRVDEYTFDLSKLGGPHSVVTSRFESNSETYHNTTYTVDICKPLKKSGKAKKGEECPNGTRICAIKRLLKGKTDEISEVIAIAGNLKDHGGADFDYDPTRLSTSDSNADSQKEGLRLVLKGGKHPLDGPVKERREQRAVIEFLCDEKKDGTEGEWEPEDKYEKDSRKMTKRAADKDSEDEDRDGETHSGVEHQLRRDDAALLWESYRAEKDADVLRLTWHTKWACEKKSDGGKDKDKDKDKDGDKDKGGDEKDPEDDGSSNGSWGFFTWLVIIVFLGVAAYLIFGSWLNYNRYGARGWDLLPHGDTIRDIPYLIKDWIRSVLNTVQGAGSRGGYSAV